MYSNAGLNKVILFGQITRDPRWHTIDEKRRLCFTLMTKEIIRSQNGDIEHEELHQVKIAEDCPFLKRVDLKKNDMVYVQGKLHTDAFTDEQNIKRYKTSIIATSVEPFHIHSMELEPLIKK